MTTNSEPAGNPINAFFREALLVGGEATRLYLVRHAQSEENTGDDLSTGDADLTEVGREQARRLGERLADQKIDAIYASPLGRTQQTANAIASACGLDVETDDNLREVRLGAADYDVRRLPTETQAAIQARILTEGTWDAFPGSEGSRQARERALSAVGAIAEANAGKRVVVVTHSAFMMTFFSVILGLERDFMFYPFNASITSVRAKDGRFVLWRLNDVAHLEGMPAGLGGIS
jgi:probable phosphoglycerate mutase